MLIADQGGQIVLNSMHKFQPRVHLVLLDGRHVGPVQDLSKVSCTAVMMTMTMAIWMMMWTTMTMVMTITMSWVCSEKLCEFCELHELHGP